MKSRETTYYFKARYAKKKLVTHIPNSSQGDNDDFLIVTGNWEARDEDGKPLGLNIPHNFRIPRESRASLLFSL